MLKIYAFQFFSLKYILISKTQSNYQDIYTLQSYLAQPCCLDACEKSDITFYRYVWVQTSLDFNLQINSFL